MLDFLPNPIAFQIGPLTVYWYGIGYAVGLAVAYQILVRLARRAGEDPEVVGNGMIVIAIAALIGGRLYHVIDQWALYQDDLLKIVLPPYTGLGVYGGIVTGLIAVVAYTRWKGLPFWRWADIIAPALFAMQAVARWGNFFNQELYGPPTTLPWGIPIDCAHRIAAYACESFPVRDHPLPSALPVRITVRSAWRDRAHLARLPAPPLAPTWRPDPDLLRLVRHRPVRAGDNARRTTGSSSASPPRRSCHSCSLFRRLPRWSGDTDRVTPAMTRPAVRRAPRGARSAVRRSSMRTMPTTGLKAMGQATSATRTSPSTSSSE